jgi:carbonic anhydrase/acetyltransferase-like protein (isoleucine patch superfamily)
MNFRPLTETESYPWGKRSDWKTSDDAPGCRVHITAHIGDAAQIGYAARIGDAARIGYAAQIGNEAQIGDAARIGDAAQIGYAAQIGNAAQIGDAARIGDAAQIGYAAQIGNAAQIGDAAQIGNAAHIGDPIKRMFGLDVPVLEKIHQRVAAAVGDGGCNLNMGSWHCGTKHCRAGWVIALAGEPGADLEEKIGPPAAARLIYRLSDPSIENTPDFFCGDEAALADIKACAEREKLAVGPL